METNSPLPEFAKPRSKISDYLNVYVAGFTMGSADVVPGVSGGTVAFVVGIYEELISSVRMIGQPVVWRAILRLQWREAFRLINFFFLMSLGLGMLSAIFLLAPAIEWMLNHQPVMIWSFFLGLVAASIIVVAPRVKVCRGRLFSPRDYVADVAEWGFGDVVGKGLEERHDPVHLGH